MQTEEEMKAQLLDAGPERRRLRAGRRPHASTARRWSGSAARWPRWRNRCVALERRGISLRAHAAAPRPGHRPAADLPRLRRPAGALVHHPRDSWTSSSPQQEQEVGRGVEAHRRAAQRRRRRTATATARPTAEPRQPAAHRRVPRGPLDQQPVGRAAEDGLRDRQPDSAGADRRGGAALSAPPRRDRPPAWTTSAACWRPSARPARRACKSPASRAWAK